MGKHIILQITQEEVEAHPNNYSLGEYVRQRYHQAQRLQGQEPTDGNPEESDEAYTFD